MYELYGSDAAVSQMTLDACCCSRGGRRCCTVVALMCQSARQHEHLHLRHHHHHHHQQQQQQLGDRGNNNSSGRRELQPTPPIRCHRQSTCSTSQLASSLQSLGLWSSFYLPSKIQIGFTFLVPAHPGSLGERAVKCVCLCVRACVRACVCVICPVIQQYAHLQQYDWEEQGPDFQNLLRRS